MFVLFYYGKEDKKINNCVCICVCDYTFLRSIRLPRMPLFHCQMVTGERLGEEKTIKQFPMLVQRKI